MGTGAISTERSERQTTPEAGEPRPTIGFVGAGCVAQVLAAGLAERGYAVVAVASRGGASARALAARLPGCMAVEAPAHVPDSADMVFLVVPDDAIAAVAEGLRWRTGQAVIHCSGALGLEVLAPAAAAGALVGALHPLQTFAGAAPTSELLLGITFGVEAAQPLLKQLEAMALALGGRPVRLPPGGRALYHAAAALASNYVVTLADRATTLWEAMGFSREEAASALLPLMRRTVANLEEIGLPAALTGPIARGDVGTVQRHLEALRSNAPRLLGLYGELALATIPVAISRGGLSDERAQEVRRLVRAAGTTQEAEGCA